MDLDYESPNITRMTLESDSCLIEHTALTEKYQNAVVPDNIYEELEGMLIDSSISPFAPNSNCKNYTNHPTTTSR